MPPELALNVAPPASLADALPLAPVVQDPLYGCPLIGENFAVADRFRNFAMAEYLQEIELFQGPLTDYDCSDNDEDQGSSASYNAGVSENNGVARSSRWVHKKESKKKRRNLERSGIQKNKGTGVKPYVAQHRVRAASGAALLVDFSMASNAAVTRPGWVGKTPEQLPQGPLSLDELCSKHSLTLFPWDGRCVTPLPLLLT